MSDVCTYCASPTGRLARRLRYALARVEQMSISAPFIEPVDIAQYPDYHDFVETSICLNQIAERVVDGQYLSVGAFLEDMRLLYNNCKTYCAEKFPSVVEAARLILELTRAIVMARADSGIDRAVDAFHRRRMQAGGRQFLLQRLELQLHYYRRVNKPQLAALYGSLLKNGSR